MSSRIVAINDLETLSMISEVCDSDHPAFTDAASCKFEAMSEVATLDREVLDWNDSTQLNVGSSQMIERTEEWTIPDWRHNYFRLLNKTGKEAELPPADFLCDHCGLKFPSQQLWDYHVRPSDSHCSFCHATFKCQRLMEQHGCFSRKQHESDAVESKNGRSQLEAPEG